MRFPEKRKVIMKRSIALGHCVCNPKQPCPCDILLQRNLCPCAGERPDPPKEAVRLTKYVRKAGCASKISHADLEQVLPRLPSIEDSNVIAGVAAGDDAGIYRIAGDSDLVQTVDVFSPVVDDPYTFGQISAANSVSDIYAMGARPLCALSIIGFPIEELPREVMVDILRGGIEKMQEAGVSVIGGHSINDEEIKCGFAVTGLVGKQGGLTNSGARAGDALVLTKPLGTGLISFAAQIGLASDEAVELISRSMATLNKDAAELMPRFGATACTDVTGFGLLGHLSAMAKHSGLSATIDLSQVPVFAEAVGCVRREVIPGAAERNRESFAEGVLTQGQGEAVLVDLLYDAQTSGGLLVALPEGQAEAYVKAMRERGHTAAARIGGFLPQEESRVRVTLGEPALQVGTYRLPERTPEAEKALPSQAAPDVACCESPSAEFACCDHPPDDFQEIPATHSEEEPMSSNAPAAAEAFKTMMQRTAQPGRVDARSKRLLAIALSISQRCGPCLKIHVRNALREGITLEEIDEVAWVAASFTGCTGLMFYQEAMKDTKES